MIPHVLSSPRPALSGPRTLMPQNEIHGGNSRPRRKFSRFEPIGFSERSDHIPPFPINITPTPVSQISKIAATKSKIDSWILKVNLKLNDINSAVVALEKECNHRGSVVDMSDRSGGRDSQARSDGQIH